ncbi:MAG: hypothetical protein WDN50_22370 [Bradyrhizobium sp.]
MSIRDGFDLLSSCRGFELAVFNVLAGRRDRDRNCHAVCEWSDPAIWRGSALVAGGDSECAALLIGSLCAVPSQPLIWLLGKIAVSAIATALVAWRGNFLTSARRG